MKNVGIGIALWLALMCLYSLQVCGQTAKTAVLKGRVVDATSNKGIPFANILISNAETEKGLTTDIDGYYMATDLPAGLYNIRVSYIGYATKTAFDIMLSYAKPANVDFALEVDELVLETVEIKANPFVKKQESPVSLRNLGVNEIRRYPGGNRDISRVIRVLPGVLTTTSFRNDILVRGGAPSENRFYLDDIEVPVINHFSTQGSSGGPVGIINVEFVKDLDFFSSAFPANKANALSSVMDFKFKEGNPDRLQFTGALGSSDIAFTLNGPLGDKVNYIASYRRSYLQFLFKAIGLPFLPTYNDFQYKVKWNVDSQNAFTFIGLGAIDNFELNLDANETESQRYLLNNLPVNEQWNYMVGTKYTHFRSKSYINIIASRNMLRNTSVKYKNNDDSTTDNLILDYTSDEAENKLRIEQINRFNGGWKLLTGVGYEFAHYTNTSLRKFAVGDQVLTSIYNSTLNLHKYAAFGQVSKSLLGNRLSLSAGIRFDGNTYNDDMENLFNQTAPRVAASYSLHNNLAVNVNIGLYHQLPAYTILGFKDANNILVNQDNGLQYMRALHYVAGLEFTQFKNAKATIEGFYKRYSHYPFAINDSISLANLGADYGIIGNEAVSSTSKGRAYGAEFLFQQKLLNNFYGLFSYTLSWSEFTDKNNNFVASSWDTRHILNFTAGKGFAKNWEVGFHWLYSTGQPYTPYNEANSALTEVWDITGQGVLNYNLLNTERLTPFHKLDVRVDKKWLFKNWNLNLYFDVENIYNYSVELQPYIDTVKDDNGLPVLDPQDPSRYQLKTLENSGNSSVLPSIGIIVEL